MLVLNNRDLNQVTWEQRIMAGDPKYSAAQDIPDFRYAAYAEMLGLKGVFVDDASDLAPAWEAVLCADRPAVLETVTDPDVPPLPPHITLKQARAYASALWQDDPDAAGIIRASLKELFA